MYSHLTVAVDVDRQSIFIDHKDESARTYVFVEKNHSRKMFYHFGLKTIAYG